MKFIIIAAVFELASSLALGQTSQICPTLPPNSNLEWQYHEGPDFDLCYAHELGSTDTAVGIYLGYAPSFSPKKENEIGAGRIAGHEVTWYQMKDSPLGREALVTLSSPSAEVAHIWVLASSQQELRARLSILEHIAFKPSANAP